ncbi:MAG: hypothetical protein AB7K68_10400 [Bacteriovoracia bacterium]
MKYLLIAMLFANTVFAADNCGPQEGKFGWEKAVKVGDVVTFFNPRLNLDGVNLIPIAFDDGVTESFSNGVCKALGKKTGTVGQITRAYELETTLAVFIDAAGRVAYMHEIGRNSGSYTGIVNSISCR